jgi:hypothetical protein
MRGSIRREGRLFLRRGWRGCGQLRKAVFQSFEALLHLPKQGIRLCRALTGGHGADECFEGLAPQTVRIKTLINPLKALQVFLREADAAFRRAR